MFGAIPLWTMGAPAIDAGVECVVGSCGNTITTSAAMKREKGDEQAAKDCEFYDLAVGWYDHVALLGMPGKDHCERWLNYQRRGHKHLPSPKEQRKDTLWIG